MRIAEIVACFPVYRSYVTPAGATAEDRRYIDWALAVAKKMSRAADVSVFDFVRDVLTTTAAEGKIQSYRDSVIRFAVKFQQFSSPVMAKGVEDTSFYIYNRLVSLNEVGGEPRTFGFTVPAFHGASQDRANRWPHTMLATSTHDSKRSEDVRVRISVLSEMPAAWKLSLRRWSRFNRGKKRKVDERPAPSRNDEYLLYQTLIGSWPLEDLDRDGLAAYCERIEQYMLKAARESKIHTSWINPDAAYENAMTDFIRAILLGAPDKNLFLADFIPAVRRLGRFGLYGGLSQVLIKLMSPGVPDIYQGMEMWNFSLVDPDNRRPVDYALRRALLDSLESLAELPAERGTAGLRTLIDTVEDGRIKLYLTWKALQVRKLHPDVFKQGAYVPLNVKGARADHVCAFARTFEDVFVIVVAARFFSRLLDDDAAKPLSDADWDDTWVALPDNSAGAGLRNVLFDAAVEPQVFDGVAGFALAPLLGGWPVALLVSGGGA